MRAGCEAAIAPDDDPAVIARLPRVLKNPRFTTTLATLLSRRILQVEHVLVPIRDLGAVTASKWNAGIKPPVPRWYHKDEEILRAESARQLGELVTTLNMYHVPHTYLRFPEFVRSPVYLQHQLLAAIPEARDTQLFMRAYAATFKPEWVHH